ncbi:MAG: arginine--tRNA ligase [Chloroflexaceae bacterium]|nr:arginine--tRNA ligase [Chloroflexaceae bacterium]
MEYTFDQFVTQVHAAIAATGCVPEDLIEVQKPKANVPADLTLPTFKAARQAGVAPPKLASELAVALQLPADTLVGAVAVAGPYLNFSMHPAQLAARVLYDVLSYGDTYGHDDEGQGRTVIVEYSSPNVAKRMHVGHIRSTIIGQSLNNIYRALGYHTVSDNHLGDWGKQFGVILAAVMRDGKPQAEGEHALAELEALYTRYSTEMKEHGALDDEARRWSLQLEQGDPQARELWQWSVDITLQANRRNYDRLGVTFDHIYGESFYEHMMEDVIAAALAKGAAYRDEDGSVVVPEQDKLPLFLLQRKDGGTLYMTRDVATVLFRLREFNPARIIYIVGSPQELHFRQLFALVRAMGYAHDVELVHVQFGTVFDAQGQPLSTRRGNMVYLELLLDEAVQRARAVIEQKNPDLPEAEKQEVAEIVGVGAVVYNDLYQDTRRNITLDWDKMLSTDGNSATYLQYSYARCRSILRKATEDAGTDEPATTLDAAVLALLEAPAEQSLLRHLAQFPAAVRDAGARYAPFVIADWCYTTAREFGVFFEQCPVLKAETPALRTARLTLVAATAQALKNGLWLLGIRVPERM